MRGAQCKLHEPDKSIPPREIRAELEETRERFVGILGHDLRNPLGTISMAADTLLRHEEVPEHLLRNVQRIAASVTTISNAETCSTVRW